MKKVKVFYKTVLSIIITSGFMITPHSVVQAQSKKEDSLIYKFKDGKGHLIYTDRLPANEKGEFSVLSADSGSIKKVVQEQLNETEIEQLKIEKEEQKIAIEEKISSEARDKALIIAYSSVKDIDNLKNYELEQIDLGIKNNIDNIATLKDQIKNLEESYALNPDNVSISVDLEKSKNDLQIVEKTLNSNKEMYAQRERKYLEDRKRYLEILEERKGTPTKEEKKNNTEVEVIIEN